MVTLAEIRARHLRERHRLTLLHRQEIDDLLLGMGQQMTQADAAAILKTSRTGLNNIVRRRGIFWQVKQQGRHPK